MASLQTNWYVITGAPSVGKSKVLEYLAYLGYSIRPERVKFILKKIL